MPNNGVTTPTNTDVTPAILSGNFNATIMSHIATLLHKQEFTNQCSTFSRHSCLRNLVAQPIKMHAKIEGISSVLSDRDMFATSREVLAYIWL